MVLLHIGRIKNNAASGVSVIVPQHVREQSKFADTALCNYCGNCDGLDDISLPFNNVSDIPTGLKPPFNKPDLVIIHEVNNIENIKLYKNLLKLDIPYIIVPHGEICAEALRRKWLKKKIAYLLFFNAFIKKSLAVQCLSQTEAEKIKIKCRKFISGSGMHIPKNYKTDYSAQSHNLVYIGRIHMVHKGLDILVDAIALIEDFIREKNIKINIYGPDILHRREILQKYIDKKNLGNIFNIYEPVFDTEKENILLNGDIFIQTSRFEGLPLGVLEAMAYGMPCILTKGTTVPSIDGANEAVYACETDAASVAEAIMSALEDSQNWERKGQLARRFIEDNFAWDIVSKNAINLYKKLLQKDKLYD